MKLRPIEVDPSVPDRSVAIQAIGTDLNRQHICKDCGTVGFPAPTSWVLAEEALLCQITMGWIIDCGSLRPGDNKPLDGWQKPEQKKLP